MPKIRDFNRITALYERLSKDDEQQGESNSILNQKQYLSEFARKSGFTNIKHFTDDGYTGRNFNRPGFQAMLAEIEAGKVGTVIVKDMSRFGRNYLQVGFYTEILFPQKQIRFIAVNNSVDSDKPQDNDFTPFLNIMNEWYAKDTSNKIKSIFLSRMNDGKRCSGSIPYGYNRLPEDKQTLVVDPVASQVVKHIFELATQGLNPAAIARKLTEEKVLIPSAYTLQYHPEQKSVRTTKENIVKAKDKAFEFKQKRMMKTVQSQRANAAGQNGSQFHYGTVSRSSASNTSVQRVKGARQTQKTIKQSARNSKNAIKTAAKGTVKTTQKSVKTAQATSKAAIKTTQTTAKSAQAAAKASAKTAQKAAQAARATAKASAAAVKTTAKATVSAVKAIIAGTKALIAAIVAGGWVAVIIILIVVLLGCAVSLFGGGGNSNAYTPVSAEVEAYDPLIRQYASQHGIPEYVELIKAVMMQESGGRGNDPMQASECGYNTRYPNTPNGITDPEYSIDVGIQNLADCLNAAEVENPVDMEHIKLALQGYNFGNGYISWAKNNYGGYSYANAVEFSAIQAERLGWDSYGDTQYVAHVLRYYPYGRAFTSGGNQAIVEVALTQLGNVGGEPYWSWYGFDSRVEWCACFVSWCAEQCGYLESGIIPKYSLCSDGVNWFRNNGQWQGRDYEPTAGNLIFFDWEGDGTIDHTGIVEKSENGTVYTVEGNSGDECKQRNYPVGSSVIYGYGIPAY